MLTVKGKEEIEGKQKGALEKKESGTAPPVALWDSVSRTSQAFLEAQKTVISSAWFLPDLTRAY